MKKRLQEEMKNAMREKDKLRLMAIRGILSVIQYEEMKKSKDCLGDDEIIAVLQSELKKRSESLEFAEKDGREDLIAELKKEEEVIRSFLPKQLTAEELEQIVREIKESTPNVNMGDIMKKLRDNYNGQFNGKLASEIVKNVLA